MSKMVCERRRWRETVKARERQRHKGIVCLKQKDRRKSRDISKLWVLIVFLALF